MPTSPDSVCFLEQTDFSLVLARGAAGTQPLRLEALQEVPLADPAALAAAVRAVFAAESATVVCALRPKPRQLHLANADEAKRQPGLSGARQLALAQSLGDGLAPAWLAAVQARDGAAPGATPWLLSATSAEGQAATNTLLDTLKLKSARSVAAPFNSIGAIAAAVTAPVWLLEIGELASHALLVSRDGVLAAGRVSLNLDRIAETVQAELGLKFRGSAVKLFFNPVYDYSETGAKIAGQLAVALKTELAALRGRHDAPVALACAGLPATQQWFTTQLAAALGLTAFVPDPQVTGVAFASPELEAVVSPAWFGFLRFAGTYRAAPPAPWQAEWLRLDTIAAPAAAKSPAASPAPVSVAAAPKPAAPLRPVPVVAERQPAMAAAAVATFTPEFAGATRAAAPVAIKPAAAVPATAAAPRAVASATVASRLPEFAGTKEAPVQALNRTAAPVPAPRPAAPAPVISYTPKPATPGKPAAPAPKVVATPAPAAPAPRPAAPVVTPPAPASAAPAGFFQNKFALGATVVAVLLVAAGFYYIQSERQENARLAAEKTKTEQRFQAETEARKKLELQAKAEADARRKLEQESARRLSESEAGRQRAEQDARAQAAARLANARGTLVIATDPAGATITVGNLPPRPSPATFSDIKIGRYPVTITLPLYDPVQLEYEIKEDTVTDPGLISLVRIVGSLELTTEPASVSYEVRPANSLIVLADARRTGRTPATLTDLAPGDYTVTFVRDGWMPHTAPVTIERNATAQAKWSFPNGIVTLTSTPVGATVTRDGVNLGVTPLTLNDQVPGDATYQVALAGYAPELLSGRIVGGQAVELAAKLEKFDHISLSSELDQQPKIISTVQPKIPYEYRQANKSGQVNIELTVTRDGSTKDLVVMPGSDRALASACLKAAAQWKFKPGTKHGQPANVRVIVPFSVESE